MSQEELDLRGPAGQPPKVGSYAQVVEELKATLEPMARLNSKAVVATALAEAGRHFGIELKEAPPKKKGERG